MANELVLEGGVWKFREGGMVAEYADYDSIPDGSEGDLAITTNNNQVWRYSSVADCWIPSDFYDSGLAIQQDRSGTPKDINFKTPQASDFSGLSDHVATGTITDNASSITIGPAASSRIYFSRETHTGDSLLISDVNYTMTDSFVTYLFQGFRVVSHTGYVILSINFCGPNKNQSNTAFMFQGFNTQGTLCRPTTGVTFTAGSRIFMKWNNADLAARTANRFPEVLIEDESERIRSLYTNLEVSSAYGAHNIHLMAWHSGGSLELSRFQILKYT